MTFDPDTITQERLHELRRAAEHAWSDETRPENSHGHPQPSAGHCYVTSKWLQTKFGGGHIGSKDGHFFWVSPDRNYVVDLTGDQDAYGPVKWAERPQDAEDEPYTFEPEQMRHRPGPIIYTSASNPLYKGFRVIGDPAAPREDRRIWESIEDPESSVQGRAQLFSDRANAALEGKITRQADAGGSGSDAYPGEGPQAEEEFNLRDFHDPVIDDLNLSMEEPVEHEYKFLYANGEFKVSPSDSHEHMAEESQVAPDHGGPMAVGYINVRGRDALWSVETNVGLRGLVKMMKDYTKNVGWKWGGLVDSSGQPIHDYFGAKKSYWYGWRDGELKLSAQPFWGSFDEIEVVGRTASFNREPNPFALPGLEEWAKDFGYHLAFDEAEQACRFCGSPTKLVSYEGKLLHVCPRCGVLRMEGHRTAEYPGGTDMNDRVKNKEWPTTYDKGDPEADPGKAFDGEPQGKLTCPYCSELLPNFKAYVLHTQNHQDPEAEPIDDGHFPTIRPLDEPLGFGTQSQPTAIPVIGAIQQDSWHFPQSDGWRFAVSGDARWQHAHCGTYARQLQVLRPDLRIGMAYDPERGKMYHHYFAHDDEHAYDSLGIHDLPYRGPYPTGIVELDQSSPPQGWSIAPKREEEARAHAENLFGWHRTAAGGKEGKDLLQAPIPFIYDIEKDYITVGHPGMRTPDVMPVGGEEPVTIPPVGLPPEGQEGQQVELGGEIYVWHNN